MHAHADSATRCGSRMAREPALACEADGNYHICEYYLSALSPVLPDALFLGSVEALRSPARLTRHRISHVLLLCSDPQSAARSPSGTLSGLIVASSPRPAQRCCEPIFTS